MSISSSSEDYDEVESNGDQRLSDTSVDDETRLKVEPSSEADNHKPTLLCAEKIWQFPVSSE